MAGFKVAGDIAARLADLRSHLKLKPPAFAKLFGRGRKQVPAWEGGRQAPPPAVLQSAAEQNGWPLEMFAEGGPMPSTVVRLPVNRQSPNHRGTEVRESGEGSYVNPRARIHIDPHPRGKWALELLEHRLREIEKEPDRIVTQEQRLELLQLAQWAREGDGAAGGVA